MSQIETIYLTASARLSDRPTLIFSVDFYSDTKNEGVVIYDANSANDERKIAHISGAADADCFRDYSRPIETTYGCYVELESGVSEVTLQIRRGID